MSYKFKVGDRGKTRKGNDYRVVCVDKVGGNYPIIALVTRHDRQESVQAFRENGRYTLSGDGPEDILPPAVTKWLNVWMSGRESYSHLHPSLNEAEAQINRINNPPLMLVSAQPVEVQES